MIESISQEIKNIHRAYVHDILDDIFIKKISWSVFRFNLIFVDGKFPSNQSWESRMKVEKEIT